MEGIDIGTWLLGFTIFFVAGVSSVWQAIKNSRTSTDSETGKWFSFGMILVGIGGTGVIWIFLTK